MAKKYEGERKKREYFEIKPYEWRSDYNITRIKNKFEMEKEQIRKNRERIRNTLKTKLSSISTDCSSQAANTPAEHRNSEMIFKKMHKKTSEEIRHFDELMYLKETHIVHTIDNLFERLEMLGEGAHSAVYKCREIKTGKIFAAKVFKSVDTDTLRHFKQHFMIKRAVNHENIIKAHYLFINEKLKSIYMINEYCPFKNLREYMRHYKKIDDLTIRTILSGIMEGVSYLHRHGICHRDLKPDNILFNPKTGELKLIDFEIAKMCKYLDERLEMWTNTGTLYYKAPEMFKGSYNEDIDLWAVGVIAYELAFGKLPFDSEYVSETINDICEKEPNYEEPGVSSFLVQFIKGCLIKDPSKRMKCYEAIHSPFFLSYSEELSPSPHKKKLGVNHCNSLEDNCYCECNKENYHEESSKCHLRRSHSSYKEMSQRNIFSQDIGIRFLDV